MSTVPATRARSAALLLSIVVASAGANEGKTPELVHVTAPRALSESSAPFANSASIVLPESTASPPRALAEVVQQQPGVEYNGQGGLFQTITIRGMGRQRLGTYYLDIPLLSERRAGTAASFIDPVMMEAIELVRGPSSILHGYGAIGGLLRVQPREQQGLTAGLGWGSSGDENLQYGAYGGKQLQLALSHRGANNSNSSAGTPLNTGFDQYNLRAAIARDHGDIRISADSLYTYADDIGKSNNLYPQERLSDYPRERHWLGQLSAERPGAWRSSVFFHAQDLETRVERVESRVNDVDNSSVDIGGKLVLFKGGEKTPLRMGVDYLGRREVDADERQTSLTGDEVRYWRILRAEQDDIALFADLEHGYQQLQWAAGLRLANTWQEAEGFDDESETYANGFSGVEWFASQALSFSLQAAAGERPANLSERYFSGTTGRGTVVGNPDLKTEKALNFDLGTRWDHGGSELSLHAFYTRLDDLIERVEIAPDVLSFRNNREGEIYGAELSARQRIGDSWLLQAGATYQDSNDDDGDTLQDTAPNRLSAGLQYQGSSWDLDVQYEYRFSKSDVAATEIPVDSARLLSTRLEFHLQKQITIALWARNLLDDEYQISTDDLSTEGEERSVGVNLTWRSL